MNLQRFEQLIGAYGSNPERWPLGERQAATDFLTTSTEAQNLALIERRLDQQLDLSEPAQKDLSQLRGLIVSKTLALRGEQFSARESILMLDKLLDWLLPAGPIQFWRPALAASLPLIVGGLLGMSIDTNQFESVDSWEDELEIMAINTAPTHTINADFSALGDPL